jgi:hypothetical protein
MCLVSFEHARIAIVLDGLLAIRIEDAQFIDLPAPVALNRRIARAVAQSRRGSQDTGGSGSHRDEMLSHLGARGAMWKDARLQFI